MNLNGGPLPRRRPRALPGGFAVSAAVFAQFRGLAAQPAVRPTPAALHRQPQGAGEGIRCSAAQGASEVVGCQPAIASKTHFSRQSNSGERGFWCICCPAGEQLPNPTRGLFVYGFKQTVASILWAERWRDFPRRGKDSRAAASDVIGCQATIASKTPFGRRRNIGCP